MNANHKQFDEDFLEFESKVNHLVKILNEMSASNKGDSEAAKPALTLTPDYGPDDFIVVERHNRTVLNKKILEEPSSSEKLVEEPPLQLDKFTFMQQMEKDADERAKVRKERERLAQQFRKTGNIAFRKDQFEKAILNYSRAIEHIKDSPILYNNRALCYIKLRNYNRALMDCDFVINKLDERNLRSWLYRAAAYRRLNDIVNFENSIKFARKNNTKEGVYIDDFLEKLRTDQF